MLNYESYKSLTLLQIEVFKYIIWPHSVVIYPNLELKSPSLYKIKIREWKPNIRHTFSEAVKNIDWASATAIGYRAVTKCLTSTAFL